MNRLDQTYSMFSAPDARDWGRSVIEEALRSDPDVELLHDELLGAMDDPSVFATPQGRRLWWEFWQAYESVVRRAPLLSLHSQGFAKRFEFFADTGVVLRSLESLPWKILRSHPAKHELMRFYKDIGRAASLAEERLCGLRSMVESEHLKLMIDMQLEELSQIRSAGKNELAKARKRLWEINIEVSDALAVLQDSTEGMDFDLMLLLRGMTAARELTDPRTRRIVEALQSVIVKALASGRIGVLEREAIAEAHILTLEILWAHEPGAPAPELTADAGQNGAKLLADFEEASGFAFAAMSSMRPSQALTKIKSLPHDPSFVEAAMIDAVFANRMGDLSIPYNEEMAPFIRGALLCRVREVPQAVEKSSLEDTLFEARLCRTLRSRRKILLELGGGSALNGLRMAAEDPSAFVFSIDPTVPEISEERIEQIGFVPRNHVILRGRAEEVVPYAFDKPFADKAVMVAPPSFGWAPMMLSALLAVRPGGTVDIYKFNSKNFDYGFLRRAGFGVSVTSLRAENPLIPASDFFKPGMPVSHVRITVPLFRGNPIMPLL
ncbi:MAG: hypothetical protein WC683_08340 [bacterium]